MTTIVRRLPIIAAAVALMIGTSACSSMTPREQHAAIGAGVGAASGLAIAALTEGNPLVGAAIGGLGGAAVGALIK